MIIAGGCYTTLTSESGAELLHKRFQVLNYAQKPSIVSGNFYPSVQAIFRGCN